MPIKSKLHSHKNIDNDSLPSRIQNQNASVMAKLNDLSFLLRILKIGCQHNVIEFIVVLHNNGDFFLLFYTCKVEKKVIVKYRSIIIK